MAKIQLEDGRVIEFDGDPTQADIDEMISAAVAVAPPEPNIPADIATGMQAGIGNIMSHIGIPGTDYDLRNLLEGMQLRPPKAAEEAAYEKAGPAAGLSKFATEILTTAPIGGGVVGLLKQAGRVPGVAARFSPAAGRLTRAGIEGGVGGALTSDDGAVPGALGGVAGDVLLRGAGRVVTGFPAISDKARKLLQSGVPVTIGQAMPDTATGRVVRGIEDTALSVPILSDIMAASRGRGVEALRSRAISDTLPPGMEIPTSARTEPLDALKEVGEEFSQRYQSILEGAAPAKINVDDLVSSALPEKAKTGWVANKGQRARIEKSMRADMDVDATPQNLFDVQSDWRKHASSLARNPMKTAKDRAEAKAYLTAANSLMETLEATNPGLQELRGPYRNYAALLHEGSKAKGSGETLSATALRRAAIKAGNKRMEELARAGESVLPSRVPDSGTARRMAQLALTGGAGGFAVDPTGLAALTGAGLALGAPALLSTSQAGTRYLLGQYPAQQAIARALEKYAATAGGVLSQYPR